MSSAVYANNINKFMVSNYNRKEKIKSYKIYELSRKELRSEVNHVDENLSQFINISGNKPV